jgi:hypothetical protein
MRIGEQVIWERRLYVLRGIDPMGVRGRKAHLEAVETQEHFRVPLDQVLGAARTTRDGNG